MIIDIAQEIAETQAAITRLNTITTTFLAIRDQRDALQVTINGLQTQIVDLQQQISNLDPSNLQAQIDNLQAQLTLLTNQNNALNDLLNQLQTAVTNTGDTVAP